MTRLFSSLVVSSLVIAGCGGRADGEDHAASGTAKSTSSSKAKGSSGHDGSRAKSASTQTAAAPTGAPSPPVTGAKEFTLASHDRTVKVSFAPPAGWQKDPMGERTDALVFQGSMQSVFKVSLTCQGSCDKDQAVLQKNIEKQFQEDFDAATSKNVSPVLTGEWLMKPKADPPGIVTASFLAKDGDKVMEQAYIRDQLLPDVPFFVECRIELDDREPAGTFERLQQVCKDLKAELLPK